jgi:hypothetical protein
MAIDDEELEVSRGLREGISRHAYYLLSVAAASIAFSVTQTQSSALAWRHLPLAIAVACWGLSFFLGCRHIAFVNAGLHANAALFPVRRGEHPEVGPHPQAIHAAASGIRSAAEANFERANQYAHWQFRLLVAGGLAFLVWHVTRMYLAG